MILSFKTVFPWGEPTNFQEKILSGIKIHTIRIDSHSRWKENTKINFCTGVRTKKYNEFDVGFCTGTQKIFIDPRKKIVWIDRKFILDLEIDKIARNDGFDCTEDFWRWFKEPFSGKIVHWMDKRY